MCVCVRSNSVVVRQQILREGGSASDIYIEDESGGKYKVTYSVAERSWDRC